MPYLTPDQVGDGLSMTFLAGEVKTKKGKKGEYQTFEMMVKHHDGRTATYDVFEKSAAFGKIYNPEDGSTIPTGTQIMAFANGEYVNWKVLPQGEAVLQEKQPSNYVQNKRDTALSEQADHAKLKDRYIAMAGWGQAALQSWYSGKPSPEQEDEIIDFASRMVNKTLKRASQDLDG